MKPLLPIAALALCVTAGLWTLHRPSPKAQAAVPPVSAVQPSRPAAAAPAEVEKLDWAIAKDTLAAQKTPGDPKAWTDLGDALMQKARETADLSYYGLAETDYKKALARDPKSVPALDGMAWVTSDRHEFEQSKAWAGKALALDPNSQDAYGLLGDADQELGNYPAAYAHYQKMLDLRPDLASYSRGGHLLWITGNFRQGAGLMVKAIDAGGPYAESTGWCRAQLGLMLYSEGHQAAAEQTLRDALTTTPRNYRVLMALGRAEAGRGDDAGAIDCYQKAIDVVPQVEAVAALGDLYALSGRKADAEQQYRLAENIDRIQKANGVRGGWQMSLFRANHDRELPEALADAQEEYKTRKNVYAADALAWCLYKTGHYPEAAAMKQGDRKAARAYLSQAIALNPNFSPVDAPLAAAALREFH